MVSIITVNYNGWRDTVELIASLKQHETYPWEVIVVDNASRGDDVEQIRRAHPDVCVVASEKNLGFAGGNNLGLEYAKGEYFFFLNNDVAVKAPVLEKLVAVLQKPRAGAVSPCIRHYYRQEAIQYCGYQDMTPITIKHTTSFYKYWSKETFTHPFVTEVMHGAAMMVSREVVDRVGKMTEVYFLFYEEFDWSRRIREAGLDIWCEPTVSVYHKESVSIPINTPIRRYYLSRGRIIYTRRNNTGFKKFLSVLYLLFVVLPIDMAKYMQDKKFSLVYAAFRGTWAGLFKRNVLKNKMI